MTRHTMTPPRSRERRGAPTAPTPVPTEHDTDTGGGLIDRVYAAVSELPALARSAASRVTSRAEDKAVDMMASNAGFMGGVGIFSVVVALLYLFLHGFMGWFPERETRELRASLRETQQELREVRAELSRTKAAWIDLLEQREAGGTESQ